MFPKTKWPNKEDRENFEIEGFLSAYSRLNNTKRLVVKERRERPDYFVEHRETGKITGVELTSVYKSDRSVPDHHMRQFSGVEPIPYDLNEIDVYQLRVIDAVQNKIQKARNGYDQTYDLILAVYVNEYCSIHMEIEDWEKLVTENEQVFDQMQPFQEIVFWDLPNEGVFSVKPECKNGT